MGLHAQIREGTAAQHQATANNNSLVPGFWYFATDTGTMHYAKSASELSGALRDTDPVVSGGGVGVKRYQFFDPGDALTINLSVATQTLPSDNNLITVHAQGNRIFPDQPGVQIDWSRNAGSTPTQITLHAREGEWIMVEWYEAQ